MKIAFLAPVFPPDNVSSAHIVGDLAADLVAAGHEVTVFTSAPHYNVDADADARQPRTNYWGRLLTRSEYQGATVYHAIAYPKARRALLQIPGIVAYHVLNTIALLTIPRRIDVILVPSPWQTGAVAAWLVNRLRGGSYVYMVQELYPEIAVRLGYIRNRALIAALKRLARFVYTRAARITVIGEAMRRQVLTYGQLADKTRIVPNFVDLDVIRPVDKDNEFAREHDIVDTLNVVYAGNVGRPQGLDVVVEAATLLRDEPAVRFVIVGSGSEFGMLRDRVSQRGLGNMLFLDYQPFDRVPMIYGASDICLVSQAAGTATDAVPSKVYRIQAAARPIVALTEPDSDLATLVEAAGCGRVIAPGDAAALAQAARDALRARSEWHEMGHRGARYVREHNERRSVTRRYERILTEAAEAGS